LTWITVLGYYISLVAALDSGLGVFFFAPRLPAKEEIAA
jgi:hypothetical protein